MALPIRGVDGDDDCVPYTGKGLLLYISIYAVYIAAPVNIHIPYILYIIYIHNDKS